MAAETLYPPPAANGTGAPAPVPVEAIPEIPAIEPSFNARHSMDPNRFNEIILPAEAHERKHVKVHSVHKYSYRDLITVSGSVIPAIMVPSLLLTAWATLWTTLYMLGVITKSIQPLLITILGVVMGLLLVFRTNTAYDRYWEGRRLWGTLLTNVRNLARFVWIGVPTRDERQVNEKRGAMNLILAFTIATKHYLRDEHGYKYADIRHLLAHLPDFRYGAEGPEIKNLPLEISFHLAAYVTRCRDQNLIDAPLGTAMTNAISAMIDTLTSFERIRNSPIPLAYSIHLKQILMLYLLSLPFQLTQLAWATIPVVFLASFTLLGIESIGGEIENPFGYDYNDLPVERFCEDTRGEINRIMHREFKLDPAGWGNVVMVPSADNAHVAVDVDSALRQRK